jgi:hydroxymethylbilane synthase
MDLQPIRLGTLDAPKEKWMSEPIQGLLDEAQKRKVEICPLIAVNIDDGLGETLAKNGIDALICDLEELPLDLPNGFCVGAFIPVASRTDILVLRPSLGTSSLENLPPKARIATQGVRRKAQLLHLNPSLEVSQFDDSPASVLKKLQNQELEGICLGGSALEIHRLETTDEFTIRPLPERYFHPGSGQGCAAILCRDKREDRKLIGRINHSDLEICLRFERQLIQAINGGIHIPLGVFSEIVNGEFILNGILLSKEGDDFVTLSAATHHFDDPDFISNIICEIKVREKGDLLESLASSSIQSSEA